MAGADIPPELQQYAGGAPTMAGGYMGDTQDLPVFTGYEKRPKAKGNIWGSIGQQTQAGALERASGNPGQMLRRVGKKIPRSTAKLSSQMERDFYSMSKKERAHLQKRLHAGGFYGNTDPNSIVLGVPDETSFKAYSTAVGRAAAYYASGQRKTLDDVLDEAAGIQAQIDAADAAAGRGGRGSGDGPTRAPLTVELTNPEDLKYVVQRTATATLGRALNDDEVQRFVSSFQGMQGQAQGAAYNAAETGGAVTAAPAEAVAAQAFARQADPTAAGGHDFLRTFQAFSDLLGRE